MAHCLFKIELRLSFSKKKLFFWINSSRNKVVFDLVIKFNSLIGCLGFQLKFCNQIYVSSLFLLKNNGNVYQIFLNFRKNMIEDECVEDSFCALQKNKQQISPKWPQKVFKSKIMILCSQIRLICLEKFIYRHKSPNQSK